jgi:hypothetical protein
MEQRQQQIPFGDDNQKGKGRTMTRQGKGRGAQVEEHVRGLIVDQ